MFESPMEGAGEKLLVVDDDRGILQALKWSFDSYDLVTASDRSEAVAAMRRHSPKVVTLDLGLPPHVDDPREGLATLKEILTIAPTTKIIVVSGNDERQNAVEAIGLGAWDFYSKPIDADTLSLIVSRAFHVHALEEENRRLRLRSRGGLESLITSNPRMLEICRTIEKVAPADVSVLLQGESGTGKEIVANAIHGLSRRSEGPFIPINCGAIPETLLESELFGYEKGAFTGALRQTKGKIELAAGGTLFLDEIGDMPAALQVKLLRFLQERRVDRLGSRTSIDVDVRIICATHQDLQRQIAEGRFREDLFYRISGIPIVIPPLRERGEDAVLIARHLIERFATEQGRRPPLLGEDASHAIRRHSWRGNVRELENRVRRAIILSAGPDLRANDLDLGNDEPDAPHNAPSGQVTSLREAREQAERLVVQNALNQAQGNLSAAARLLEVSRPTLYALLRQHRLGEPAGGPES
jgi:two-component system, NtrC family, response regulator